MTSSEYKKLQILLNDIKNGRRESFSQIYSAFEQKIYFLCCKVLGDDISAAKELTASVFCDLYKRIHLLEDAMSLEKQLYSHTLNKCKKHIIENSPEELGSYVDTTSEEGMIIFDKLADDADMVLEYPDGIEIPYEMMKIVDKILSDMPLKLRCAILEYYFCGFETDECTAIEQITVNAFANRLYKAHIRLKTEEHKYTQLEEPVENMVIFMADVLSEMAQNIIVPSQVASNVTSVTGINCISQKFDDNSPTSIISTPAPRSANFVTTKYAPKPAPAPSSDGNQSASLKVIMAIVAILIIIGATVVVVLAIQGKFSKDNEETTTVAESVVDETTQETTETTTEETTTEETTTEETTTEVTTTEVITTVATTQAPTTVATTAPPAETTAPEETTARVIENEFNLDFDI